MRTIGVLTSGGDAPGMNAAVRAVVRTGCVNDIRVMGVRRGFTGLLEGDMEEMTIRKVSDKIHRGGTMLYTSRCPEIETEEGMAKAIEICRYNGIEGLVVIGGDGSFRAARDLSERGLPCIGIPATIDNDIGCCDYTIGYDTALNTIIDMVDKIRDTTESHGRCSIIEVMGRHAGYLALNGGIGAGATVTLIPEVDFDIERDIIEVMKKTQLTDKKHFIIMVAEGVIEEMNKQGIEDADALAKHIGEKLNVISRATVLGYVQRGGSPSCKDRVVASEMGCMAVHLFLKGQFNKVIAMQKEEIKVFDIDEALKIKKSINAVLHNIAKEISI